MAHVQLLTPPTPAARIGTGKRAPLSVDRVPRGYQRSLANRLGHLEARYGVVPCPGARNPSAG